MAEEGKKISFGFSKSIKKSALKLPVPQEVKKVDYIECLDDKSIKVIGKEEKKDEPLVIPLRGSRTWHDRIVNKTDADIFEPKTIKKESEEPSVVIKKEKPDLPNGKSSADDATCVQITEIKVEPGTNKEKGSNTLEEQAAKEIIEDLNATDKEETKTLTLPMKDEQALRGEAESTLEDYENIPVDAFGLAMLRGMGWQPGKGIGKNDKIVAAVLPELRPKGMGLGADKVTMQKKPANSKKQEEELKIEKGTLVKIIAGKQCNNYGQIEGLDDDAGRLIVKLALGGNSLSLSEFMVQPVTKSEYSKNAKVLNAKKFEEYKDKASTRKSSPQSHDSSEDTDDSDVICMGETRRKGVSNQKHKSSSADGGKSKSRKRRSSESGSDSDRGKRSKRRSRSSSSDAHKSKKSKKTKKHKRQDTSPERSSKKHKKKDKEKDKYREKRSKDSEHTERRKRKKHRSRSRSPKR